MLPLATVINVSVASIPQGLANYNLGNLLLISSDAKPGTWGTTTYGVYLSPDQVYTDFGASETYNQAVAVFSQQPNILANNGKLYVYPGQTDTKVAFDTLGTSNLFFFSGIITTIAVSGSAAMFQLATDVQAYQNKIMFLSSGSSADITTGFTGVMTAALNNTRCLYYAGAAAGARLFAAAYASRLLGTNLEGSNTAVTMQFKNLIGITPDETITSTILTQCEAAGVDVYVDIAGVSMTYSSGANKYADQVYNLVWLVNSLKVALFNTLYQVANKIPQTEDGINLLKSGLKQVLAQGVASGYMAPGSWTSATTFGNQADFISNILQYGYYIYSVPVALQLTADRNARKAPVIQIAAKEAGAVHSSSVLVYINP